MPTANPDHQARLIQIIAADHHRLRLLDHVAALDLPDCWIGAGFVRNAVWDALHGRTPSRPAGDVDIVWFDPARVDRDLDRDLEARLRMAAPDVDWSVKNQARMHSRHGHAPYGSVADAIRHWPETATAIAVRRTLDGLAVLAPFGLDDLFALRLRPTMPGLLPVTLARCREKAWLDRWPLLRGPCLDTGALPMLDPACCQN